MKSGEAIGMVKVGRMTSEGKFQPAEDTDGGWIGSGQFAIELGNKNYYLDYFHVEDVFRRTANAVVPRLKKHAGFVLTSISIGQTRGWVFIICD